jgi:REP element-mobilizing transposase RayT
MLRTALGDGLYHVWRVAVDGTPAFADDRDRISFLRLFAECVYGYEWEIYAWCLMTTHYHLVIQAKQPLLSAGMQRLNSLHAQRVNHRRNRKGHVFRGRFSSRLVEGERYARAVCRYVLLNPVEAGLCQSPDAWRWSWCRWGKEL